VPELPNLDHLSHAEKDALIRVLWRRLEAAERRIAELEARLAEPGKTPDNFCRRRRVRSRTSRRKPSVADRAKAAWVAVAAVVRWRCFPTKRSPRRRPPARIAGLR
jgi:hypothetical protein